MLQDVLLRQTVQKELPNGTGECDGQPDPEPNNHPVPDQGHHQQTEKAERQAILDGRSHPHPRAGGTRMIFFL